MPWTEKQKKAAQVALHAPERLLKRNRSFLTMSREELKKMATGKLKKK